MKKTVFLLAVCMLLVLSACSTGGEDPVPAPGVTTLIYANLTKGGVDSAAVDRFNRAHENVQIEVRDYFDEDGINGRDRLLTEIAAGKMPDIIDLHVRGKLPYQQLAHRGYLEDLLPYIENDPDIGREGLLEAPVEAAKVDGGLYAAFSDFYIETVAGRESVVGNRYSWSLEDLLACYAEMPEESTILYRYTIREEVFRTMLHMGLDRYVDWDTGECSFDNVGFRTALEFLSGFPDEYPPNYLDLTNDERSEQSWEWLSSGRQMLYDTFICIPEQIQANDILVGQGERMIYIGYPTGDGSAGSYFRFSGPVLGMSAYCKDKEAAWEFLREMLLPQYEDIDDMRQKGVNNIPINCSDFELLKKYCTRYKLNSEYFIGTSPTIRIQTLTEEEFSRFEDLIGHVDKTEFYDTNIYEIVYEVASAYFSGDKTLDEAIGLIQQRVNLYVNEMR